MLRFDTVVHLPAVKNSGLGLPIEVGFNMNAEEVKSLVQGQLQECEVFAEGEGSNYQVVAVGDVFAGLNMVKRHQLIYACLNEQIASGDIHAVTIKTYAPTEWNPD